MGTAENEFFFTNFSKGFDQDTILVVSAGVILLILIGSIYKVIALSKGGAAVAEMLGGHLISNSATEHNERMLLNVVEEMSLAAGMPIPKVYLLDEAGINAFAAGQSHSKAVIGVTKGALNELSRDELQGVIAHEFSHILNGDMKINIRLIGLLHGILLIGIIGDHILNSMRYRSSGKKGNGGAILIIGFGLMAIGYAGTFFGGWIKASISRQREYLADASAVQFTRNKDTISGALKKIGGLTEGSFLESPSASEYSHAYFAEGVSQFFSSMFATHPPLAKRIKSIDPGWNGKYTYKKPTEPESTEDKIKTNNNLGIAATPVILAALDKVINQIGTISEDNINYVKQLAKEIPGAIRTATQSPYSARAVLYGLLVREQNNKENAWLLLDKHADKGVPDLTRELYDDCSKLDEKLILSVLEMCISTLRELSLPQYKQFKHTINTIITSDKSVDLNEWVLQRLVIQQLDEHFSIRKPAKDKHAYLGAVKHEAEVLLSLLSYTENKENDAISAQHAFESGVKNIGAMAFKIIPKKDISLNEVNSSLDELMQLKPVLKERILKACAAIIMVDGKSTRKGIELFRTLSSSLDCPVPPIRL